MSLAKFKQIEYQVREQKEPSSEVEARIREATAKAVEEIRKATAEAVATIKQPPGPPMGTAVLKKVEVEHYKQPEPLWKRFASTVLNILDYPGRVLTETAMGVADVAKQSLEKGGILEKIVGVPVLTAGAFAIGAMGGIASLVSPKAWYETIIALAKPRETLSSLKQTVTENPFRIAAITGALVAPVKLPRVAGVGVIERVRLVPEKVTVGFIGKAENVATAVVMDVKYPIKSWRVAEAEAQLARIGKLNPPTETSLTKLEFAIPRDVEYKVLLQAYGSVETVKFRLGRLPSTPRGMEFEEIMVRSVKLPGSTFMEMGPVGFHSAERGFKALAVRLGEGIRLQDLDVGRVVKTESIAKALAEDFGRKLELNTRIERVLAIGEEGTVIHSRKIMAMLGERYGWNFLERTKYIEEVKLGGLRTGKLEGLKFKELEGLERLEVKGGRFKYRMYIVDPEANIGKRVVERIDDYVKHRKPNVQRITLNIDDVLKREIEVIRPLPGPPGLPTLAHIVNTGRSIVKPPVVQQPPKPELDTTKPFETLGVTPTPTMRLKVEPPGIQPPTPFSSFREEPKPPGVKPKPPDVVIREFEGLGLPPRPRGGVSDPTPKPVPPPSVQPSPKPEPGFKPEEVVRGLEGGLIPPGFKPRLQPKPPDMLQPPSPPGVWRSPKPTVEPPSLGTIQGLGLRSWARELPKQLARTITPPDITPKLGSKQESRQDIRQKDLELVRPVKGIPLFVEPDLTDLDYWPYRKPPKVTTRFRVPDLVKQFEKTTRGKLKLYRWEWLLPEWGKGVRRLVEF